jgi:uncharacterized membrane protein (UPF0127 family)
MPKGVEADTLLQVRCVRTDQLIATHVKQATAFLDRCIGLLRCNELPHGQGLWIEPCQSIHTVGMRFAIDVLFLAKNYQIIKKIDSFSPMRCSAYYPEAVAVLELAAHSLGGAVRVGDCLTVEAAPLVDRVGGSGYT